MKELIVNEIIEQDGVTHGIVGQDRLVKKNLYTIYDREKVEKLLAIFNHPSQPSYFFDGFCQYVIYVQYQPSIGLSMKVSDFKGDINLALDEYRQLRIAGWNQDDTNKIMRICQQIQKTQKDWAKLIVQSLPLQS